MFGEEDRRLHRYAAVKHPCRIYFRVTDVFVLAEVCVYSQTLIASDLLRTGSPRSGTLWPAAFNSSRMCLNRVPFMRDMCSMMVGSIFVGTYTYAFLSLVGLVVNFYSVAKLTEKE